MNSSECYVVLIDGYDGDEGPYELSISCGFVQPLTSTTSTTTRALLSESELQNVTCGSKRTGSTVGLPNVVGSQAGNAGFLFCPNQTGLAEISTCGSSFDTWLYVFGPQVAYSCDDCGDCGVQTVAQIEVNSSECYVVLIDGYDGDEGSYELSISCGFVQPLTSTSATTSTTSATTSTTSTTTRDGSLLCGESSAAPLAAGGVRYQFCSDTTGAAEINTCGSSFTPNVHVEGPGVNTSCEFCQCGQPLAININNGSCYDILINGSLPSFVGRTIRLSIGCIAPLPIECGRAVSGSTSGLPDVIGEIFGSPGDAWYSFCPNTSLWVEVGDRPDLGCANSHHVLLLFLGGRMRLLKILKMFWVAF
eukprot:Skav228883  [mRNA]  locus=scaffold2395:209673:210761:+ [translate_table: standard]